MAKMNKDKLDMQIKWLSEEELMSSNDIVKRMKNLGISIQQSTVVRVIGNKTRKKLLSKI